jgi:hypothetical protein
MTKDPVRWSADPSAPPAWRALVRANADDGPTPDELARLGARMQPQLAAPPSPWHWLTPLRAVVGAAVIAGAGVTYVAVRPSPVVSSTERPAPSAPRTPEPPPAVPAIAVTPPAPALPPQLEPARPAAPHLPTRAPARVKQPSVPATPASPVAAAPSEVELLEQAHAAMRDGDPARALARTGQHERLYADGVLAEEREALAIEALAKLGRRDDARARWTNFATSYPQSNYRARLQHVIGIQPAP